MQILPAELSAPAEQLVWGLQSAPQLEVDWSLTHCHLSEGNPLKDKEGILVPAQISDTISTSLSWSYTASHLLLQLINNKVVTLMV